MVAAAEAAVCHWLRGMWLSWMKTLRDGCFKLCMTSELRDVSWLQGLQALMDEEPQIKAGLEEDEVERFPVC